MKSYECEGVVELKLKLKTFAFDQESAANELSEKFNYVGDVISKHILKEMGIKTSRRLHLILQSKTRVMFLAPLR